MLAGNAATANRPRTRSPAAAAKATLGSPPPATRWTIPRQAAMRHGCRRKTARHLLAPSLTHSHQVDRRRYAAHGGADQRAVLPLRRVTLRAGGVVRLLQRQRTAAGDLVVLLQLGREVHRVADHRVFEARRIADRAGDDAAGSKRAV